MFILKAYLRKYVANQIYVSMSYFKNLVPVMDEYGMRQNNDSNFLSVLTLWIHTPEEIIISDI